MNWLPDMDLNHDKQIQSLLCYRYTIGQTDVWHRLGNFVGQSSRQATVGTNESNGIYARPHPGPLPRGEGAAVHVSRKFGRPNCSDRLSVIRAGNLTTTRDVYLTRNRRMILPLLGERAGVRAVVSTNFSRITHCASH